MRKHLSNYGIDLGVAQAYEKSLLHHIDCVVECGKKLGVAEKQLRQHDASKWSYAEFAPYAIRFYGGEPTEESKANFDVAIKHHFSVNPHHWIFWVDHETKIAQPMPENYMLEMIADWQGATLAYNGDLDMRVWLGRNWNSITLEKDTRANILEILQDMGYSSHYNVIVKDGVGTTENVWEHSGDSWSLK
jgi:hypothetical protein